MKAGNVREAFKSLRDHMRTHYLNKKAQFN
jgi:hypothetical protein